MSVHACASNLELASRTLLAEWNTASQTWHDARGQAFAKDWMEELPGIISQARRALEELDSLLKKVTDDCS